MKKGSFPLLLVSGFIFLNGCHFGTEKKIVLKGNLLPQKQDWSVATNALPPLDVTTNGPHLTFNTIGVPRDHDQLLGKTFMWFYRSSPFDLNSRFSIEFSLKVHKTEQPHNLLDAGIMFYGSTEPPTSNFAGGPRNQMIYFDENAIGWGDESGKFEMDTTDSFHTYTLKVNKKGVAKVYVDGTLALQRNDWEGKSGIGFGDMTNDEGLNGKYSLGKIIIKRSKK